MSRVLDLETGALSALTNLSIYETPAAAVALVDELGIVPDDFASAARDAWVVAEAMLRDGRTPDFYAIQTKCPQVPRAILSKAFLDDSSPAPVRERLRLVRDSGNRRRILNTLRTVVERVADTSQDLSAAIAEAQRALETIQQPATGSHSGCDDMLKLLDHLDEVTAGRREPVLATGIVALDKFIGGLQPTLTIIGALPGVGKSALIAAMIRNLIQRDVKVGLFSLEDEATWVSRRFLAEAADVPLFVLQNRPLRGDQIARINDKGHAIGQSLMNLSVDDRPGLTCDDIVSGARAMIATHHVKAVFVDHLGEIRLERTDRHDLDIANVLRDLRSLAKTYSVPVVVACHLRRREGLDATAVPKLTDFAFSAGIERMARVALGLYRPDKETLTVQVLKQTCGVAGAGVNLNFIERSGTVGNEAGPGQLNSMDKIYGEGQNDDDPTKP